MKYLKIEELNEKHFYELSEKELDTDVMQLLHNELHAAYIQLQAIKWLKRIFLLLRESVSGYVAPSYVHEKLNRNPIVGTKGQECVMGYIRTFDTLHGTDLESIFSERCLL